MDNKIKNVIESISSDEKKKSFLKDYDDKKFFKLLANLSEEEKCSIDELILKSIDTKDTEVLRVIAVPILEKKKFIDWKKKQSLISSIFDKIIDVCSKDKSVRYNDFVEKLVEMLDSQQLVKVHAAQTYKLIKLSFGGETEPQLYNIHLLALHALKKFPWAEEKDKLCETMKLLEQTINKYVDSCDDNVMASNINMFFLHAFYLDKNNGRNQKLVLKEVTKMFEFCSNHDWQSSDEPNKRNLAHHVLMSILQYFIQNMGITQVELMKPMYKTILSLRDCDDNDVVDQVNRLLADVANDTGLVGDDTITILESYLDGKMDSIAHKLKDMYLNQPEPFQPLILRFSEKFINSNDANVSSLLMFFTEVARKQSDILPDTVPRHVLKYLNHQWYFSLSIMFFDAMATSAPGEVIKYEDDIIRATHRNENAAVLVANLLPKIAIDEDRKARYINYLADKCRVSPSSIMVPSFVNSMRIIGSNNIKLLIPHKELLEELMEVNPNAKDICRAAINVIEGKSLEKVAEEFMGAKKDMNLMQEKMVTMGTNVDSLKVDLKDAKEEVENIQTNINENSTKLDELEVSLTNTKVKVEQIDNKTLSHAPSWSREVSKLLNQSGDRDWRLLARRLGYNNDDVINWATQSDPCMSMMDDWFATHKTREATHGVLKVLDDMDRKDAYSIVEEAIKDAEYMVGDDEDDDESTKGPPPTIFLSYQWALQPEVKLLRKHLGLSGYPCWMDIGQMGGGDKLYSKIDEGLRSAKVVVCCISERYAESPNCNREVNLAVNLGKPIIPLLMEKMEWPPKGGMGPIFGEYLFVRFYRRAGEGSEEDGVFWPPMMFNQLIMQIRYSVVPIKELIPQDSPYKDWWNPPEEVIIIKKKDVTKVTNESKVTNQERRNESPEVFISYQWDVQNEIKELYRRLSEENLNCWLDINMMGGGDSLYDKIDKGIRGSKVVISCVTKKYALSSNCRREVALSDAIKKPLIPLLLEEGAWPPEGPMGMVLTQLLYIDFSQSGKGSKPWDDDKFEELLKKILQQVNHEKDPMETKPSIATNHITPSKDSKPAPAKSSTDKTLKSKQPINKQSTSTSSLFKNRNPSSSSSSSSPSSSSSSAATTKTKNKVLHLFKSTK